MGFYTFNGQESREQAEKTFGEERVVGSAKDLETVIELWLPWAHLRYVFVH